jgi:hypothetical protein
MIYVKEFKSRQEVQDFLQGLLVGSSPVDPYKGLNVRGLTMVFSTPVVTITFPDTVAWGSAKLNTIVAFINAATSQATAGVRSYGYGQLEQTAVICLTKEGDVLASGTALPVLGLVAATVGATKISKTDYLELEHNAVSNVFFLTYDK